MTSALDQITHVYIGRKKCGCVVAFCVDDPKYASDIAELVRNGYELERVTVKQAQDDPRYRLANCEHGKQQKLPFAPSPQAIATADGRKK